MSTSLAEVKGLLDNVDVKKRFNDVLGKRANQFMSTIINTVTNSDSLKKCESKSIIGASLAAASLDLPIDSNLGFSAIVPYKCKSGMKAQFQIMAKGFIQLAIRTGQYKSMNYSEIYSDELESYNPITKDLIFVNSVPTDGFRSKGQDEKVVGYFAWIQLKTGFRQTLYMTTDEIRNHAKKYSASYKMDLSKGWKSSKWSTDFHPMACKTIIKLLLSKWGILSIDIQQAITSDQQVFNEIGEGKYLDNKDKETIDVEVKDPFAKDSTGEKSTNDEKTTNDVPEDVEPLKTVNKDVKPTEEELAAWGDDPKDKTPESKVSEKLITEAQRKRLFAIYNSNGYSNDELKAYIGAHFRYSSTKEITKNNYEEICKRFEVKK